jgi:hypothetical protein
MKIALMRRRMSAKSRGASPVWSDNVALVIICPWDPHYLGKLRRVSVVNKTLYFPKSTITLIIRVVSLLSGEQSQGRGNTDERRWSYC